MTDTTTSSPIGVLRRATSATPDHVDVDVAPEQERAVVLRRGRALRSLGVVLLAVVAVAGTTAWVVSHRSHRPMPLSAALPAAEAWCAYNFPPPHSAASTSPNLNTSACRLGFLDGAENPNAESTPEERRIAAAESQVGATNPQGMWDIAYLAGWTAGHDAARAA